MKIAGIGIIKENILSFQNNQNCKCVENLKNETVRAWKMKMKFLGTKII